MRLLLTRLVQPLLELLQKSRLSRLISEGDVANARRDWSAAEALYSKALSILPTLDATWIQLGHALKEQGHLDRAEHAYRSAIAIQPNVADSHLQLGHVLKLQNRMDAALNSYLNAYRLDPRSADILHELAALGVPIAHGNADTAKTSAARQTAARFRGDKARDRRDWEAAAAAYRSYLSEVPEDFAIQVQLGHVLKESGRFDEALETYRFAHAINPSDPDLLLNLGHLAKCRGDLLQAARFYTASSRIDDNPHAIKELNSPALVQYRVQAAQQTEDWELLGPLHSSKSEDISIDSKITSPRSSVRPIILMIDAWYPRPDRDSGSLDQISFIRIFQTLGYEVHFAADLEANERSPYRDCLIGMGIQCVTREKYITIDHFLTANARRIEVCFLSRVHFGARYIDSIRRLVPDVKIVFNTVDLHHIREYREAALAKSSEGFARAALTRELELSCTARSDATIVVSDRERALLQAEVTCARIFMVPLIREYPVKCETPFSSRSGIGFIGGFRHKPNVDAVNYFLDDIWPLLRQHRPCPDFFVIGADLPKSLSERSDPGVTFVGYVPELSPWLNRLKMTVAPLRYGAGAKGKVVSSLAHGVPCVASPIAAEGMGLIDGREVLVGRTPREFVESMVLLEHDEAQWLKVSNAGMEIIRKRHSFDHGLELMAEILATIGASTR